MNFIDVAVEQAKKDKENFMDFLNAPQETNDFLSDSGKGFADNIGQDLGIPEGTINTMKDWEAVNKAEEDKLKAEEEGAVMGRALSEAASTGKMDESKQNIAGLAKLDTDGIPYAASISANRENFAASDVNNPGNLLTPYEVTQRQMRAVGKNQVLKQAAMEAREEAHKSSWGTFGKEFVRSGPGFEAHKDYEAIEVLGLKLDKIFQGKNDEFSAEDVKRLIGRIDANTSKRRFLEFLTYLQERDDVSEEQFGAVIKDIRKIWNDKGINIYTQAELLEHAYDESPGLSTFNAAMIVPTGANTAGFLAKAGKAAKQGLITGALYNTGLAITEATSIPFGGKLVNIAMKPVKRAVRLVTPKGDVAKTLEKAIKTNDRETIKLYVEELIGKPTDTENIIKSSRDEGVFHYFIDPIVDAADNPERSLANAKDTIAQKIQRNFVTRLKAAIDHTTGIETITQDYIQKLGKRIMDSLDMDNLIAAGRGRYGEKIVALTDLDNPLRSKEGNLVYAVKLVNDNEPVSAFMSQLQKDAKGNLVDVGRKKAEKLGKALAEAANVNEEGLAVDYAVDYVKLSEENGYWRPTLLIDTKKGLGIIHYEAFEAAKKMKQSKYRPFMSWLFTVTSNPSDIRAMDIIREVDASIIRSTTEATVDSFKSLPKASQKYVQALVDISTDYGAWFEPSKLLAAGASEGEVTTYMNFRLMNDIDEFIRNKAMRTDLISKGGKSVWFNGKKIDGVVRPVPGIHTAGDLEKALENKRVLIDSITGVPHALTDKTQIADYFRKGYILIEPSISPESTVSARSFYYLLNPQSTSINELGAFVTTYVAGGRRFFNKNAYYIKQLVMGTTEKGNRTITGVQTFFTDMDPVRMGQRMGVLEEARKLWIRGKKEACTKLIQSQGWQKAPFSDADTFYNFFKERGMDFENIDNALEMVQTNEVLKSYTTLSESKNTVDLVGLEGMQEFARNSKFQALSNEAKIQKMKRSGRELLTWDFEKAQTVDFEQQMRYLLRDMLENQVMGVYTDYVADRFAKTFASVIDGAKTRDGMRVQMTPREMLLTGNIKKGLKGADADLGRQALTAQKNFAMIRGVVSDMDKAAANALKKTIEWVADKAVPKSLEQVRHGVRVKWEEWVAEKNPLLFLRTFTAHKVLGCFNPQQFLRQASQDISIALMDPLAVSCAFDAARIEAIMLKSGGDRVAAAKFAKEAFKGDTELLNNALNIIDMGLFEHGTAGGFVERGATVATSWSKLSFLPFNIGEMHPRILSGLTALKRKGLYGQRGTVQTLMDPSVYARSLFMNMDASGISRMQNSQIAATILQFQTPTLRWFETLIDPNLTKAQRMRLGIGTALLVGGEGILGVSAYNTISNNVYRIFHDDRTDDLPSEKDANIILDTVRKGILNEFLSDSAGGVNLAAPLEINAMEVLDLASDAAEMDIKDVASAQAVLGVFKGVKEVYMGLKKLFKGTGTDEDLQAFLERFPRSLPSSISKPWLAYNIYKTGEILNTKGELTERTNGLLMPVMYALGFNSLTNKEIAKAFAENQYRRDLIDNFEKQLYETMIQWARHKSPESWDAVETLVSGTNLYPEEKAKSWRRVWNKLPQAFREKISVLELQQYLNSGMSGDNLIK